ncbi:ABC transporter substrate-binding protein [Parafrankia sp. BMG5.11]|uniref:ABC transporter substrate-binding protein n=1 Tax=Parafrankia sp. BMG5.11 TaxID=222540 RepID=UPI00103F7B85|nr:transporter substrate-binding domain-containing protein [Parafrankia sp. BMG5.11]
MKRRIAAAAALALLGGTLAACAGNAGAAGETEKVKIMIGGIDKIIYLPAKLTEQLGFFADEGVEVQLLTEPSGAQAENVLISGDVQGVVGFYDHAIDLQTKGKCIQSVVQFADVPGEAEVVATDKAGDITSTADFAGRRLGITSPGSSTDFLTRALATAAGVQPSDYTTVKAGAGQTFIAAMEQGSIDAGMTTDPTIARLVASGQGKVLVDMRTQEGTEAALGGLYPASSLYMDCDWVAANKPTVQKLANAFVRTLGWIDTHSAADIAAEMPKEYAGDDPELYRNAIDDSKGMFTADGVMPTEGAENVLRVLASFSPNVQGKEDTIDLSRTYTTEFVSAVPES